MEIPEQKIVEVKAPPEFRELYNPSWRNIVFHGGRYSGKSRQTADALLVRGRRKKFRILCTREVQKTIKDSVHKLLKDSIERYGFYDYVVSNEAIVNALTGTEFLFKGLRHDIQQVKSMEGIDICWVEEAQAVTEDSLDVLTPTIRKEGSQLIFTFNRFTELDPVYIRYVMHTPPRTFVKQVNYDVLERENLLSPEIALEIANDKLNNPLQYAHKWLGEPISQDESSIIPRDRVMEAMNRTIDAEGTVEVGVDVARMGSDKTVLYMVKGLKTLGLEEYSKQRTTAICDKLELFVDNNKRLPIKIDDTGVGGGVTDEMIKREYTVIPVNFGGEPLNKDLYPNLISEAWFSLLTVLDEAELPLDQDLLMQLTTRQWKQDNKGRRVVESKKDYKKRGYKSPDKADACIIAYYRNMSVAFSPPNREKSEKARPYTAGWRNKEF